MLTMVKELEVGKLAWLRIFEQSMRYLLSKAKLNLQQGLCLSYRD